MSRTVRIFAKSGFNCRYCIINQHRVKFRYFSSRVNFSKDYYRILELSTSASLQEIRKKYLEQAKKWHPDSHSDSSEDLKKKASERFLEVQEAYEILSNKTSKQEYDSVKLKVKKQKQNIRQADTSKPQPRPTRSGNQREGTFTESDFEAYRHERSKRRYQKTAQDYEQEMRDREWREENMRQDREYRAREYEDAQRADETFGRMKSIGKCMVYGAALFFLYMFVQDYKEQMHHKMDRRRRAARAAREMKYENADPAPYISAEQIKAQNDAMRERVKAYHAQKFEERIPVDENSPDHWADYAKRRDEGIEAMIEESRRRTRVREQEKSFQGRYPNIVFQQEDFPRPSSLPPIPDDIPESPFKHGQIPGTAPPKPPPLTSVEKFPQ